MGRRDRQIEFEEAGGSDNHVSLKLLWQEATAEPADPHAALYLFLAAEQAASFGHIDVLRFAVEDCKLAAKDFGTLIKVALEEGHENIARFMAAQPALDLHTDFDFPGCTDFSMMLAVDNTISDGGEQRTPHDVKKSAALFNILYQAMIKRVAEGTDTPQKVLQAVRVARDQATRLVEPKKQEYIRDYGREDCLPKIEFENFLRSLQKRVDGGIAGIKKDAQLFSAQASQRKLAM